jgi:DNA polymerase-3 subunit epsilon
MNFTAIDFETANEKRTSPCSIGLASYRDGQLVDKAYYLIKPHEIRFMPINIGIHGIRPSMVKDSPEFPEVWDKIKGFFECGLIAAHNASFDISVLRKTAELYGVELPSFNYICTVRLAKSFYPALPDAKLNTVNDYLGYSFQHHDALYDAFACGNILNSICSELNCQNIDALCSLTGVCLGSVCGCGYSPCSSSGRAEKTSWKAFSYKGPCKDTFLKPSAFIGQTVVFTGKLDSLSREEAIDIVRRHGGSVGGYITKATTLLITNLKYAEGLSREDMSTKLRRAMDYNEKGACIKLLDEEEFLSFGS